MHSAWQIEEGFQQAKTEVGLDHYEVRCYHAWYRWTTLALLAHAFLVVAALTDRTRHPPPPGPVGLTCNELQHLFAALLDRPAGDPSHRLRWSAWRRRHRPALGLPLPPAGQRTVKLTTYG